eukprot:gene64083-87642_t
MAVKPETSNLRNAWHGSLEISMTEILTDYDPAEDLDTPEAISAFVNEALKTDDAAYIAHALGVVARAKGMAGMAEEGRSRKIDTYSARKHGWRGCRSRTLDAF